MLAATTRRWRRRSIRRRKEEGQVGGTNCREECGSTGDGRDGDDSSFISQFRQVESRTYSRVFTATLLQSAPPQIPLRSAGQSVRCSSEVTFQGERKKSSDDKTM
ncbi:hypothetical protein B296_00019955 [Ensete ventricosum]|uniref:Uncharacterized protein n=1 Tax=Ensete ventricosum TaxID=4639 RepID=A0A427B215_ENSVE|nr:hypothetical protein B296_00019955 [Ensete ventricosum]